MSKGRVRMRLTETKLRRYVTEAARRAWQEATEQACGCSPSDDEATESVSEIVDAVLCRP